MCVYIYHFSLPQLCIYINISVYTDMFIFLYIFNILHIYIYITYLSIPSPPPCFVISNFILAVILTKNLRIILESSLSLTAHIETTSYICCFLTSLSKYFQNSDLPPLFFLHTLSQTIIFSCLIFHNSFLGHSTPAPCSVLSTAWV